MSHAAYSTKAPSLTHLASVPARSGSSELWNRLSTTANRCATRLPAVWRSTIKAPIVSCSARSPVPPTYQVLSALPYQQDLFPIPPARVRQTSCSLTAMEYLTILAATLTTLVIASATLSMQPPSPYACRTATRSAAAVVWSLTSGRICAP